MNTISLSDYLVKTLRATSTLTAEHYCQCGQVCRTGKPCIPVTGEVEVTYTTVAEKRIGYNGRLMWAAFSYDPQSEKRYTHSNQWYDSPCKAVNAALCIARDHGYQLRLDKAGQHHDLTVDLSVLERKLATDLYNTGYNAWLDQQPLPRHPHALVLTGYNAARNETTAAIAEKDPGIRWELDNEPEAVSWNSEPAGVAVPF